MPSPTSLITGHANLRSVHPDGSVQPAGHRPLPAIVPNRSWDLSTSRTACRRPRALDGADEIGATSGASCPIAMRTWAGSRNAEGVLRAAIEHLPLDAAGRAQGGLLVLPGLQTGPGFKGTSGSGRADGAGCGPFGRVVNRERQVKSLISSGAGPPCLGWRSYLARTCVCPALRRSPGPRRPALIGRSTLMLALAISAAWRGLYARGRRALGSGEEAGQ